MAGILVIGDAAGGRATAAFLELATAGEALARASGEPLSAALIVRDGQGFARQQMPPVEALYLFESDQFRRYLAPSFIAAAQAVIDAVSPSIVLFAHTLETRDWVPQLAARIDTGLVMDCIALTIEGEALVAIKPVYGGSVLGEFAICGRPKMATLRSGVFAPAALSAEVDATRLNLAEPAPGAVTFLDETAASTSGGINLKDAKIIVSGGRGVGGARNWHFIESAAAALGAAVGCSRPVADSGWVSSAYTVGLSGTSVKPDLYIAVGISGAVQHLAGISAARTVVAINNDADADIFSRADLGVAGDYQEVLPAFVERVKQFKA